MTPKQQRFLVLLEARCKQGAPEKEISDFVFKLDRQELQDCLDAFIGVSAKYGIEKKSMAVFWALSTLTLAKAEPFFALKYEYLVRPEAKTQWSERFAFLGSDQKKEEQKQIATRKKQATYLDFRRLALFQETEADIEAGKKAAAVKKPAGGTSTRREFAVLFQRYMTIRDKKSSDELTGYIFKHQGAQLEECLLAYLDESKRYPVDELSLQIFFGISSLALHKCGGYFALKYERGVSFDMKADLWQRFAHLDDRQKGVLRKDIAWATSRTRVLDELRFAYFQAHGKDPDDRALRAFEPPCDIELSRQLAGALSQCDHDVDSMNVREYLKSWDMLVPLFGQKGTLTLVALLKRCREWLRSDKVMRDEIYWYGVGALFVHLLLKRKDVYKHGLDDEEKRFFLSSAASGHPYYGDFEHRLQFLFQTWNFTQFAAVSKAHAALQVYASKRNMKLATMNDTARVYGLMESLYDTGPRPGQVVRIPVRQPENLLKDPHATVGVGETFGDLTVVWLDGTGPVYMECRGLEKVLFIMYETEFTHQLGRLSQDRFYDVLWANTQHILEVMPVFFQILTFLPDLVSGGLTGLAKSIVLQVLIDETTQAVFGDSKAGEVFATSAALATGHLTQTENRATKAINNELRATQAMEEALVVPKRVHTRFIEGGAMDEAPRRALDDAVRAADHVHGRPPVHALAESEITQESRALERRAPVSAHDEAPGHAVVGEDVAAKPAKNAGADKARPPDAYPQRQVVAAGDRPRKASTSKKAASKKDDAKRAPPSRDRGRTDPRSEEDGKARPRPERQDASRRASPPAPPPPSPPRKPDQRRTMYATQPFTRDGIQYRFIGTMEDFDALMSRIPTRFQVYEIRNSAGQTVYVGITGGGTLPRNALDRLREHLYTKQGDFIGDAHTIHIRGTDLDEHVARAFEDSLIDQHERNGLLWNKRAKDPQAYERKYGQKPSPGEVRRANNANLTFKIDLLPP